MEEFCMYSFFNLPSKENKKIIIWMLKIQFSSTALITYSANIMSIVRDFSTRGFSRGVCVCVLTMTPLLKAGIRPITGERWGRRSDPQFTFPALDRLVFTAEPTLLPPQPALAKTNVCVLSEDFHSKTLFEWGTQSELIKVSAFRQQRTQIAHYLWSSGKYFVMNSCNSIFCLWVI